MLVNLFQALICLTILFSCTTKNKIVPTGYFRIDLPSKEYERNYFEKCNFSTEIPIYLNISFRDHKKCWINLTNEKNNITIHLTHHKIKNNLDSLLQDAHNLVYEGHYRKADGIWETVGPNSTFMIYELSGEVATPIQFYVTDKINHFLRGSMYPVTTRKSIQINRDSLSPIIHFYKKDIEHLIKTIDWTDYN